jgi:multimeric flavodoxin WrbA
MRALIVCGSRDGGFTSEMCRSFSRGLDICGVSSEIVFPIDMEIKHCSGCGGCSEIGDCIISDDMDMIYTILRGCDLLVLATPIHFSGPSSVIKTVIDRFQPMWFTNKGHQGYIAALLSGGSQSPNFTNTVSIFRAFSITAGMEWLGHLEISGTDGMNSEHVSEVSFEYGKDISTKMIRDR